MMGHILHDWNMDEKKMLLSKTYDALPKGGALIIHEAIIDDERKAERLRPAAEPEYAHRDPGRLRLHRRGLLSWMRDIGFQETYVEYLAGPDSMVVGIK